MNEVAWLPALLVLGLGLAGGLAAGLKVRRNRRRRAAGAGSDLRRRDLEQRRDELYLKLRSPDLEPGDRDSLELAAAHVLRELDGMPPARAARKPAAKAAPATRAAAAEAAEAPQRLASRHPALVGFVAGMAVVLLVVTLVYLAVRDSGVGEAMPPSATVAGPAGAPGASDEPHPDRDALPEETRRELERLEAAVAAAPDDLLARKRLALGRLSTGLYFDAYRDAEEILTAVPEDPDGLFIQGVVRLSMGQATEAVELLDRVIARYPEHIQAMVYRGLALAQDGDLEAAIATWELGLEGAGGSHPELERLIQRGYAELESAAAAPPPATSPAPARLTAPAPAAPPPPAARPATAEAASAYRATVELAPGRNAPPGSVLFVFLRPAAAGPPAAVKRIASPRFPLEVTLGADDAMMAGAAVPEEGVLVARLSASGSASSRGPGDLEASSPAALGQPVQLVLGGS